MISTGICRWLFLLVSLSTWTKLVDAKEMRVVCYYTNWSVYRPGQAKFSPQNINPYLCTHLVYAFGGFTKENTLKPFDKYQDIEKGGYAKFIGLKTYNKNLKTLIAIGGWNEGSTRFSPMVASAERRKELVKNTVKFLRQNHFDGLDLDWEYPTFRDGGKPRDRDNYAQLVKELREEFERESEKTGRPRLLLTMAVPAGIEYINKGYDVPKLTKYLDWMNILSYDYHSAFEPAVNHHAPLYSLEEDNEYNYDTELNIDYTIKHYLKMGAEPNKLVLGIPTYGRSYTLFNPDAYEIGSPADGPGDMGDATRENGYLAYYEICENVKNQDWEVEQPNPEAMGPIAFKGNQWVGYDDENIVRKKAEYVAENALGGIMFWAIDNDDFRGNCHGRPYPLIEAGKEALLNAYGLTEENLISPSSKPTKPSKSKSRPRPSKTTTTEEPSESVKVSVTPTRRRRIKTKSRHDEDKPQQKRRKDSSLKSAETSSYSSLKIVTPAYTTPEPPATPDMGGAFKCEDEGFFPHPKDCKKYFWCLGGPGDSGIVAHQFTCPAGLYFNKAADSCDYSQNVLCNKKLQKALTSSSTEKDKSSVNPDASISEKSTPSSLFSTSRTPPKITAATSKTTLNFRTTTTTTEAYEDEYEYEDEEPDKKEDSEEDPRVLKELIDLIKKAGGIEELEKQLKFGKDGGSQSTSTFDSTTPPAISKKLYERVLSKTSKNALGALRKSSLNRNSGGPQGDVREEKKEVKADRSRPQYKILSRQRPAVEKSSETESIEEEKAEVKEKTSFRSKSSLEYVNIRRPKASSTTTETPEDDGLERNKILGELEEDEDTEDDETNDQGSKRNHVPQYVNIRRQRPSTTEHSATSSKYVSIRRSTASPVEPGEAETDQKENKYQLRRGSTTEPTASSDESTSLRYQTIRRATTSATTEGEDEELVKNRSTTVQSKEGQDPEGKYSSVKRLTTTASSLSVEDQTTSKYQTISRDRTTQSTTSSSEGTTSPQTPENVDLSETVITENNDSPGTTTASLSSSSLSTVTTENIMSSTLTESNSNGTVEPGGEKKRPVLFQPRPFSIGTTSTTTQEPTATTAKVSANNFKLRSRANSTVSTTVTPSSTVIRSRTRGRFSSSNTINNNVNQDVEQEEKVERTGNKPIRTRKRLLVTTEAPIDFNEEYNRKYRPAELADLSSLTAADLRIQGGQFVSKNKRRRPVASTSTTTTTPRPLEEIEKTGARTLTLARKAIDVNSFGKSRRLFEDQQNASSDQTSTAKVRGFRSTTSRTTSDETSSSTPPQRTRKVIRRFRPGSSTEATTALHTDSTTPTISSTTELLRKRIPLFKQRLNKIVSPLPSTTTVTLLETSTTIAPDSPLLRLLKPKSRFDVSKNDTNVEDDDNDSNEHVDVLNGEEGENIKLSESNIRESSQINTFGFDDKPGKRLKFDKRKEDEITYGDKLGASTTTQATFTEGRVTEPSRILRTRKIIRKLNTASTTEATTTTTAARKRIILRRLRPTNINHIEEKSEQKEASTTESAFKPESVKSSRIFKPINVEKTVNLDEEKQKFEPNKFRVFRPTTEESSYKSSPKTDDDDDDDEEEEQEEDDGNDENYGNDEDDDDIPKYTIFTTSSVKRTHQFESNINFNDEDEEGVDQNVKANKTVTSHVYKTALNSREESETILDHLGKEMKENANKDNSSDINEITEEKTSFITHGQDDMQTPGPTTTEISLSDTGSTIPETTENIDSTTVTVGENDEVTSKQVTDQPMAITHPDEISETASTDYVTTIPPDSSIVGNPTETTTEFRRRSTLRAVNDRPRLTLSRRTTEVSVSSTTTESTSSRKSFTRTFGRSRLKSSTPSNVFSSSHRTSPLSINKLLYKYSTTEKNKFVENDNDEDEYEDDEEVEDTKAIYSRPSTTARVVNKPVDTRKLKTNKYRPKFTSSSTTETIVLENLGVDTEAVKNRNKNLFAKRKMNTPATPVDITEYSTEPSLTTLQHIFAESDTTTMLMPSSTAASSSSRKIERLIEVNRIVEVNTKEANVKNQTQYAGDTKVQIIPTVDKIGEISRITLIKIVDGNNETIIKNPESNEIGTEIIESSSEDIKLATVQEIPASQVLQNINLKTLEFDIKMDNDSRKDRKFEIFGDSKVANDKELANKVDKPEIIDGISHINVVTPKPLLVTEASTISLQGLFQTEKPHLNPSFTTNDEVLETGLSEFVNVRVLNQDQGDRLDKGLRGSTHFIPVRVLPQDEEESTVRARVMEISPRPDSRTIKIVPIRVEMSSVKLPSKVVT